MSERFSKIMWLCLLVCLGGCEWMHRRPANVPSSAAWVDSTFIDCSVEVQSKANRCTVYDDKSGQILAEGLFVLGNSSKGVENSELRFVAYGQAGIYLEDLGILYQRTATQRDPSHQLFAEKLNQFASKGGSNPLDCGEGNATEDEDTVSECALEAFAHRKPFFVRYYEPGFGSFRFTGVVGASDATFYRAIYSSGQPLWIGGLGKDGQLLDGNRTFILPCPKPPALPKARNGNLTCFPERVGLQM